jgi:hypothetical protein
MGIFFLSSEYCELTNVVQSHTSPSSNEVPTHLPSLLHNHNQNNNMSSYSEKVSLPSTSTSASTTMASENNNFMSKSLYDQDIYGHHSRLRQMQRLTGWRSVDNEKEEEDEEDAAMNEDGHLKNGE